MIRDTTYCIATRIVQLSGIGSIRAVTKTEQLEQAVIDYMWLGFGSSVVMYLFTYAGR